MYNYKARIYSPTLGRFLQTDPIGYADGINWYNYVGGDPVNRIDPTGMKKCLGSNINYEEGVDCGAVAPAGYSLYGSPPDLNGGSGGTMRIRYYNPGSSVVVGDQIIVTASQWTVITVPRFPLAYFKGVSEVTKAQAREPQSGRTRAGGDRTRKISPCMQGWLGNHYGGFDWSRPTISSDPPLPGMAASTNSDLTVFVGGGRNFDNFEKNTWLFFHEMAHFPQWAGGSLTTLGYVGSAFRHLGVHDNIPVEIEADTVRDFLNEAYKAEGKPCG
jgi:hypothetical protein